MIKKRGQVWIEAVTYTLIAFVMIGLVLSFAKPKIKELEDHAILEQSMNMIKEIDSVIQNLGERGVGNKRKIELNLKKGDFEINAINDSIIFSMESSYLYSQPGQTYEEGSVAVTTTQKGKYYFILMERNYSDFNFTYGGKEENKKIPSATTSYTLFISNKGGEDHMIDFEFA